MRRARWHGYVCDHQLDHTCQKKLQRAQDQTVVKFARIGHLAVLLGVLSYQMSIELGSIVIEACRTGIIH